MRTFFFFYNPRVSQHSRLRALPQCSAFVEISALGQMSEHTAEVAPWALDNHAETMQRWQAWMGFLLYGVAWQTWVYPLVEAIFFFFQFPDLAYIATTKWYWQHGYLALENIVNKLSFPLPAIHHCWITLTQTVKPFMHGNFIKQSIVFPSLFEAKLDDLWNWRCLQSV